MNWDDLEIFANSNRRRIKADALLSTSGTLTIYRHFLDKLISDNAPHYFQVAYSKSQNAILLDLCKENQFSFKLCLTSNKNAQILHIKRFLIHFNIMPQKNLYLNAVFEEVRPSKKSCVLYLSKEKQK